MLSFFKKTGRRQQADSTTGSDPSSSSGSPQSSADRRYGPRSCYDVEGVGRVQGGLASFDDEGLFDIGEFETSRERSRLSKSLSEVVSDKTALPYFIQFLESRNALQYVRCWLDIENFRTAVCQYDDLSKKDEVRSASVRGDHDSLSVSTDCDSYTADSTSLYDYSEKSKPDCDKEGAVQNKLVQEFTEDALRIFKKYVALEATESVNCQEGIRNEIIENICNSEKVLTSDCFKNVQEYVFGVLEKDYFDAFLCSDYFCKYQIDVLTSGSVVLEDILYNETALFYFMEFLEQESNRNMLEFWLAATNFHQQLHDQKDFFDPIEAQNDAVILYDKYFSLQALCPLGFGDKIRFAVEQNICGENGLIHDCFHLPLKIVEQVLDRHYLKPFLASQLFYKYLSELINTVQSNGYCMYDKKRSISSECGSEKSSTFLAMELPVQKKKKEKGTDMNIDTRELYDPDALWRRKKSHRLSFGRVTELGKFVTDFEPQPDRRGESMLKNVMKKFVNLEEDKRKEELAWQVAEMIVKDITSVTLSEPKT